MDDNENEFDFESEMSKRIEIRQVSEDNFLAKEIFESLVRTTEVFEEIKETPLMCKAIEIVDLVDLLVEEIDGDTDQDFIKTFLMGKAAAIVNQIISIYMEKTFINKYEQCIQLRMEAESLKEKLTYITDNNFPESENMPSILKEIERFRLLFVTWSAGIWKMEKETDRWGLIKFYS